MRNDLAPYVMLAAQAQGHTVETIEGLAQGINLHPIQQAFIRTGAIQSGYSTPAMILAAKALLDKLADELGVKPEETTEDLLYTLKIVKCVGSCGIAPVVRVGEDTFGRLGPDDIEPVLAQYRAEA